jgi:hypothetical protein
MPDFTFLLDDADISGTARLVMAHADALVARGHHVRIVTAGAPPTWRSSSAEWVYVDELRQYVFGDDERAMDIATLPLLVDEEFYRYRSRQFAVGSRQGQKHPAPGWDLLEHEPLTATAPSHTRAGFIRSSS